MVVCFHELFPWPVNSEGLKLRYVRIALKACDPELEGSDVCN